MAILGGLRINTVTFLGTLLLAGAAVVSAVTALIATHTLGTRLSYSAEHIVPSIKNLAKIRGAVFEARIAQYKYALAVSEPELRAHYQEIAAKLALVDKELNAYAPLVSDPVERALFEVVQARWQTFKSKSKAILKPSLSQQEKAQIMAVSLTPNAIALRDALSDEIAHNEKVALAGNSEAAALTTTYNYLAKALILFAIAMTAAMVLLLRQRLSTPLNGLINAMTDMAKGNLDRTIPGEALTDEIGDIGRALAAIKVSVAARSSAESERQMAVQRQVVSALGHGLAALRNGKLTASIDQPFPGEYERLRNDFNDALASMADLIRQLAVTAQGVRNGATEISAAASDLAIRTERQAASLSESTASVRELSQSANGTAQTAADANTLARNAQNNAASGGDKMIHTVAAMNQIAESSRRMQEIVGIIESIAFQTNLLALNAGVEAARAGESGRGFAVVATEVRALAQRSADAAKDIGHIIQLSGQNVAQGVTMMSETQKALTEIVGSTQELSGMIESIAIAARDQSATIMQLNGVVADMDRSTQQNAALVEQSTAASQSLLNEAEAMNELVNRFEINANGHAQLRWAA